MEVHHPKGPIHSWRDVIVELVTIVAGVLIALSFEGMREWYAHRALAHEARETILRELTENQKAIDGDVRNAPARKKQVEEALQFANDLLKTGKTEIHTLGLNFNWGDLRRSSWRTAEQTGALGHMAYGDVQKYAAAYDLQDLYQTQQRRTLEHLSDALVLVASGVDPDKASKADLERFRDRLLTLSADLFVQEQFASQLSERYARVLKEQLQ